MLTEDESKNWKDEPREKPILKSKRPYLITQSTPFYFKNSKETVWFQHEEGGMIRLQVSREEAIGCWTCYEMPAMVTAYNEITYIGTSGYYGEKERVYRVESEGLLLEDLNEDILNNKESVEEYF